jgi:D-glycero-alpha-D-manno-heptose 1-phosphate guanylyltransferase
MTEPAAISQPVIILAGGKGTRLRSVVSDVPKPMAPVGARPFLHWLIQSLVRKGATRVIVSAGYMHEAITAYVATHDFGVKVQTIVEQEPLGTGGAVKRVMDVHALESAMVVNGDTYFDADLSAICRAAMRDDVDVILAARRVADTSRYGRLSVNDQGRVVEFLSKGDSGPGLINGGTSFIHRRAFRAAPNNQAFSLESDLLQRHVADLVITAIECPGYFLDIGIPDDYARACLEIPLL